PSRLRENPQFVSENSEATARNPSLYCSPAGPSRNPGYERISPKQYPNIALLRQHKDLVFKVIKNTVADLEFLEQLDFDPVEPWRNLDPHIWPELDKLIDRFQTFAARSNSATTSMNPSYDDRLVDSSDRVSTSRESGIAGGQQLSAGSHYQASPEIGISETSNDHFGDIVMLKLKMLTIRRLSDISISYLHENTNDLLKVTVHLRRLYDIIIYLDKIEQKETGAAVPNFNPQSLRVDEEHVPHARSSFQSIIELHKNPLFLLICVSRAVHFITFICTVTTVVDFIMDQGLSKLDGKYAIAFLSSGDAAGRILTGWVTDRGFLDVQTFTMLIMIIQVFSTASLPFILNREWIFVALFVFGMFQGSLYIRHPVLVTKYIPAQEHSTAMGFLNFFSGFFSIGMPAYIGFFRDTLGSYNIMFFVNGGFTFLIGLLWFLEPYFLRRSSTQQSPGTNTAQEPV
ncbi:monocarboxylate transporter 5, partial [Nephila pilipes]